MILPGGAQSCIPHARKQLTNPTISEGSSNNDVWRRDAIRLDIDEREHKGCQCESRETERNWVGEYALSCRLIETRLEFTTEGGETCRFARVHECERVAAIVVPADTLSGRLFGAIHICLIDAVAHILDMVVCGGIKFLALQRRRTRIRLC